LVDGLSSVRLYIPKDLKNAESRKNCAKSLREVQRRFADGLPTLDPVEDMKIDDENFQKLVRKLETLEDKLHGNKYYKSPDLVEQYAQYEKKVGLEKQVTQLTTDIKNASQDVTMRQTLKQMKRVLRRLGHTTADNVIDVKGRIACEISTCDELLGTELMFGGLFNELNPEQIVALVSCLVFTEPSEESPKLKEDLAGPLRQMQEAAKRIAEVVSDCRLPVDKDEYVAQFKPAMMDVVYAWCKGAKFSEICKMTDIFEGTIIRCMRRLEELLRQFALAAKSIGNSDLEAKFNQGIDKLKRDIVFAASLYL